MTFPYPGHSHAPGGPWTSSIRTPAPMVDAEVAKHVARMTDPSLITVSHTPNAVTTHVVAAAEGEWTPVVRMEQGRVVTKVVTEAHGTLIAVVGGPAVVEIALHETAGQRDRYRADLAVVDAETRAHTLDAMQSFATPIAVAVAAELGWVAGAEDAPADDPADDPDEDNGPALWALLLNDHGPCTCAHHDDDAACTPNCALCAALPDGWPCPAWSGAGYGPGAVAT